jgi:hypothetical protein
MTLIHGHKDSPIFDWMKGGNMRRKAWRETWTGDPVTAGEIFVSLLVVFLFICVGLVMSVGLACVVGGLISWLTGFPFVPTTIFVWVIMILFGRGR